MARKPAKPTPRRRKPAARRAEDSAPAPGTETPQRRFVLANLISHLPTGEQRAEALDRFNVKLMQSVLPFADVIGDNAAGDSKDKGARERRILVVKIDPRELAAKMRELPANAVAEPELPRTPAIAYPRLLLPAGVPAGTGPGTGSNLALTLVGPHGEPVAARVFVAFHAVSGAAQSVTAGAISDAAGAVSLPFDPNLWRPALAAVEPHGRYWTYVANAPQSGQTLRLEELDQNGPLRWWHLASGIGAPQPDAGAGIRVGVVDTGVGPHPDISHAIPVGAFVDGNFVPGAAEARDCQTHGTHVCGIIGARPGDNRTPIGFAPGAELSMVRIFGPEGGGSQGDVAGAIDLLSGDLRVDIINLSLTGPPSAIEHDAVAAAYHRGTVCVCAAGNQSGAPLGAPALYPESIAVSALGLLNGAPASSMAAFNMPTEPDRFAVGGLYLASFSNFGPKLFCVAPGNGIVSTIPAVAGDAAPYADMSGTSMSSPAAAGILASILARDDAYTALDRSIERAAAARIALARHCASIGLNPLYMGLGMARAQ